MGLSFLNGAFLGALSLVSIPIIIHLLQRRRFRVVRWGAMDFLRVSTRNRSRRLLIEQLILLLIRCLIIALVVLAVSRPVVRLQGLGGGGRGQVHAVLILDNSYSMGYRLTEASGDTAFDQARKRALDLIDRGLRQGDAVSVILASDPPKALIRAPSLDRAAAANVLKNSVSLSDAGTNYGRAARLALEILSESRIPNREVYLISDNQKLAWESPAAEPSAWEALSRQARLVLVPTRSGPAANVAVQSVEAVRGLATVRGSTRIQARIANHGPRPVRDLLATLEVDGQPQGQAQRISIDPKSTTTVHFDQIFDQPGVRRCAVRLTSDRLSVDDVGYLALRVRRSVRVLVLNGKPDASMPQRDAAFFLTLALAPPVTETSSEPTALEPRVISPGALRDVNLTEYDVVALSNVPHLGTDERQALAEFVQNGGGAVVFLGDRVNSAHYNRDLFDASPSFLPARLGQLGQNKATLDPASLDHPALQRFKDAQDVDVDTAQFQRYFTLEPNRDDRSVRVMARFSGGAPALVEKQFGLGRVVLAATGATTEWSDLPLKPAFLPLIHQMMAYLAAGADGTRNGRIGQPLVKPLPLNDVNRAVAVTQPDGSTATLKPVVDERGATVMVEAPDRAGFYRFTMAGTAGADGTDRTEGAAAETGDVFAVNRDAVESDLESLDQNALRKLLPAREWSWIGINEDLLAAVNRSRQGVELWRHLLFAAMLLMALETMLAQVFGRRA